MFIEVLSAILLAYGIIRVVNAVVEVTYDYLVTKFNKTDSPF